jgi:hypothetical protein
VLVTTAKLTLAWFAASAVSLKDGKVDIVDAQEVPFLRFRKQLSFCEYPLSLSFRTFNGVICTINAVTVGVEARPISRSVG